MFFLNETHIRNGRLSSNDFSRRGLHVPVLELPDFPCVAENKKKRTEAIWATMRQAKLNKSGFRKKHARDMAGETTHTIGWIDAPVRQRPKDIYKYFGSLIQKDIQGVDAIVLKQKSGFCPGLLDEEIEIRQLYKISAAFVMRAKINEKKLWSIFLGTAENSLKNYPKDDLAQLYYEVHEWRHLLQTGNHRDTVLLFYSELDADMFANATFRRAYIGAETRDANLHFRYLCLLDTPPQYWHAPALEALESGEKPPNFFQIHDAVMEIRFRLALQSEDFRAGVEYEKRGRPQSEFTSQNLQEAIRSLDCRPKENGQKRPLRKKYGKLSKKDFLVMEKLHEEIPVFSREDPDYLPYLQHFPPLLRQLVEEGAFEKGSLSLKLAERILRADDYFNPRPAPLPVTGYEQVVIPGTERVPELAFI